MAADYIHADGPALDELKQALATAGEDYKKNILKLNNLMIAITNDDIQGDLATDLKTKFEAKQDDFNDLAKAIETADEYVGVEGISFTSMLEGLKESSR